MCVEMEVCVEGEIDSCVYLYVCTADEVVESEMVLCWGSL